MIYLIILDMFGKHCLPNIIVKQGLAMYIGELLTGILFGFSIPVKILDLDFN